jgi:hypothetical protein
MSDEDFEVETIEKEIEKQKRIIGDDAIQESYQPTEDTLDPGNPPGGGSGVPEKDKDED